DPRRSDLRLQEGFDLLLTAGGIRGEAEVNSGGRRLRAQAGYNHDGQSGSSETSRRDNHPFHRADHIRSVGREKPRKGRSQDGLCESQFQ
ncbi:MAG TPA: hypothetical protein VJB88_11530, partial [Vicinamibacteria bacterium]|nr:hypothetical protein [Vicinamibacteria bacterium]